MMISSQIGALSIRLI